MCAYYRNTSLLDVTAARSRLKLFQVWETAHYFVYIIVETIMTKIIN